MGLDVVLDNADRSSKYIAMFDQQMYQITPQITLNTLVQGRSPHLYLISGTGSQFKSVLPQG